MQHCKAIILPPKINFKKLLYNHKKQLGTGFITFISLFCPVEEGLGAETCPWTLVWRRTPLGGISLTQRLLQDFATVVWTWCHSQGGSVFRWSRFMQDHGACVSTWNTCFFYDRRRKPVSTLQRIIIVQEYFGKKLQDVDDGVMVMVMMTEMIFIDHLDYFCFLTIMIIMLLRASLHVNLSLHSLLFPLCIYFLSFLEASRLFLCPSYNWNSVIQV